MNEPSMDDKIQQLVTAVLEAVDARLDGIRHELVQFAADADHRHHDVLGTVAALQRQVDALAERPASTPPEPHQSVADLNERMAQATKILVERMEAAHHETAASTDRKVARLAEQIEELRAGVVAQLAESSTTPTASTTPAAIATHTAIEPELLPVPVEVPAEHAPAPAMSGSFGHVTGQLPHLDDHALDEISRPLFEHGHVTAPTPRVSDTARLRQVTAPPIPPLVPTSMSHVTSTPASTPTATSTAGTPPAHAAHEDIDIARLTSLISEKLDHLSLPNRQD